MRRSGIVSWAKGISEFCAGASRRSKWAVPRASKTKAPAGREAKMRSSGLEFCLHDLECQLVAGVEKLEADLHGDTVAHAGGHGLSDEWDELADLLFELATGEALEQQQQTLAGSVLEHFVGQGFDGGCVLQVALEPRVT